MSKNTQKRYKIYLKCIKMDWKNTKNYGKLWKIVENVENCGKLWKIVENCGKLWKYKNRIIWKIILIIIIYINIIIKY